MVTPADAIMFIRPALEEIDAICDTANGPEEGSVLLTITRETGITRAMVKLAIERFPPEAWDVTIEIVDEVDKNSVLAPERPNLPETRGQKAEMDA